MKKTICVFSAFILILSVALTGCSGNKPVDDETQPRTTTFDELRSYYDELAKGEIEVEIATTAVKGQYYAFDGDISLLPDSVLDALKGKVQGCYERIYSKYGSSFSVPIITVYVDSGYTRADSNYAVGNMIYINPTWFAANQGKTGEIIYGLVQSLQGYQGDYPEWLEQAIQCYIRAEFDPGSEKNPFVLPDEYNGNSYDEDPMSGAAFLKWVNGYTQGDFVQRLNRSLQNGSYDEDFWGTETGLSFGRLWDSYKNNVNIAANSAD